MYQNRSRLFISKPLNIGQPPGSLPESASSYSEQSLTVAIDTITYNYSIFRKGKLSEFKQLEEELDAIKSSSSQLVHWIDIESLRDINLVKTIGEKLDIHPLILEDITHTHQRPKFEDWDSYIYLVVKMIYLDSSQEIVHEQVSFILGPNYLISFQEYEGDVFNVIRKRLESNKGRLRKMQADYLMYSLLDAIADNYFLVLDSINEKLIDFEDKVNSEYNLEFVQELQNLKQEMLLIRRYALPFKEMITSLIKQETNLLHSETLLFMKDLQDHMIQILESLDMLREISMNIIETNRSIMNNRMNEVMKLLTIVSTIFIPITFIVGVYGMNFKYMPELDTQWAYPAVWGLMLTVVIGMLIYFKKKKWL